MSLDVLLRSLSAHAVAGHERSKEDAHRYGAVLREGTHNAAHQRRYAIAALTRSLIDHDRVITGRYVLDIGVK